MRWWFDSPAGGFAVDQARTRDADALIAVHRTVLGEREYFITETQEYTGTLDERIAQIRDLRRSANSVLLVARRDLAVLGFLTAHGGVLRRMRHTAKIELMVHPSYRGQGVGRALMSACVEWAEGNPELVKLGLSVFATNERAIALYRRLGFAEEGRREREYRMEDGSFRDDLLMYRWVG